MRSDLAKCTTEQPRSGGALTACYKLKFGGKVRIHPDSDHTYDKEFGGFHSSARHRHYQCKEFSDCLGALRGNLRVAIGRRWDDVFSEFCRNLDRRSLAGYHIWTHLQYEIETKTFMENGKVYGYGRRGGTATEVNGFYVDPVSGLVCYKEAESLRKWAARWRREKDKAPEFKVPGDEDWSYKQFDGIWFRYRIVVESKYGFDVLEKRQANKKEVAWIKTQL